MKKKYRHRIVEGHVFEYDYSFHWPNGTVCPYNLQSVIESPVVDGRGVKTTFAPAIAFPIRIESGSEGTTLYVETCAPIL